MTSAKIVTLLNSNRKWAANTVRTMLTRLIQKKVLTFEAEGKTYHYEPLMTREECVKQVSQSFLDRVFEGTTASLLLHFAKSKPLSRRELAELEAVLHQKRKEK